jgi:hypothetical protein
VQAAQRLYNVTLVIFGRQFMSEFQMKPVSKPVPNEVSFQVSSKGEEMKSIITEAL